MWVADKLVYRSEDDFIMAYKGSELVWELPSGLYYVSWTPSSLSGSFSLFGQTYNMRDYMGYYYWKESGVITSSAFQSTGIKTISTNVSGIGNSAFESCISLSQVSLPMCSYIGNYAFNECRSLSQVSLPMCSYIDNYAFNNCGSLSQLSLPVCSYIGSFAFQSCGSLKQVSLPKCSYIGEAAFIECRLLSQVSLPMCSYIGEAAFNECKSLSQISIPMCSYIGSYAFQSCGSLKQVSLPKCSYIGNYAFLFCYSLNTITIGYSGICSLNNISAFEYTLITSSTGDIYVPASLVNAYKSAKNWSYFSNRIYSIR